MTLWALRWRADRGHSTGINYFFKKFSKKGLLDTTYLQVGDIISSTLVRKLYFFCIKNNRILGKKLLYIFG